jgi:hypothetical protein
MESVLGVCVVGCVHTPLDGQPGARESEYASEYVRLGEAGQARGGRGRDSASLGDVAVCAVARFANRGARAEHPKHLGGGPRPVVGRVGPRHATADMQQPMQRTPMHAPCPLLPTAPTWPAAEPPIVACQFPYVVPVYVSPTEEKAM